MKKKDYIQPVAMVYDVNPADIICGSPKEYDGPIGAPLRIDDNLTDDM